MDFITKKAYSVHLCEIDNDTIASYLRQKQSIRSTHHVMLNQVSEVKWSSYLSYGTSIVLPLTIIYKI